MVRSSFWNVKICFFFILYDMKLDIFVFFFRENKPSEDIFFSSGTFWRALFNNNAELVAALLNIMKV